MKFRSVFLAAIAGVTAMASTAASAADFFTYRFEVAGIATRDAQVSVSTTYHLKDLLTGAIEFVLPASSGTPSSFSYTQSFGPTFAFDTFSGAMTANRFTASEATTMYTKGSTRDFQISACGSFAGLTGSFSVATDPACSTANFFFGQPTGQNLAGDAARFEGFVRRVTVTEGFGTPAYFGLIDAPILAIPEPASWAMMILGMGAVGGAMRRRQRAAARISYSCSA